MDQFNGGGSVGRPGFDMSVNLSEKLIWNNDLGEVWASLRLVKKLRSVMRRFEENAGNAERWARLK